MTRRRSLHVSDVKPARLDRGNCGPLVARCKSYHEFHHAAGVDGAVLVHSESRVGSFTILVNRIETASRDLDVRRAWAAVETWASDWGVTII